MKKLITSWILGLFMIVNATSAAVTSTDTFKWAYDNWGVDLKSGIYGESKLERQQFAPTLLRFIEKIAKKDYQARSCTARDLNKADQQYQSALEKLCSYHILNGEQGSLYPLWKLTNGQAVALIMRVLDGTQDESILWGRHWAQWYYDRASQLWYYVGPLSYKKNEPITYENLINFLYSTQYPKETIRPSENKLSSEEFRSAEDALKKLAEIMTK